MKAKEFLESYSINDFDVFGKHEEHYSLDDLLNEYARIQIEKDREAVISQALKWESHDCDSCACSCRGDWVVNNPDSIRNLPINLD